jgi:hypothetical protein
MRQVKEIMRERKMIDRIMQRDRKAEREKENESHLYPSERGKKRCEQGM